MLPKMSFAVVAALVILTFGGAASAQSFGIYVGPPVADYDNGYAYGMAPPVYGPRVYGYSRSYDDDRGYRTRPAGRCGEYKYWNGDRCADARWK